MSHVTALTWDEFYRGAERIGYRHRDRLKSDIRSLTGGDSAALSPFMVTLPQQGQLLMLRGTLLRTAGKPPVDFALTLAQDFPNSYPAVTIDRPGDGWVIKRHPHVDGQGRCYLSTVTNWHPRRSSLQGCVAELRDHLGRDYPFERSRGPMTATQTQQRAQEEAEDDEARQQITPLQAIALGTLVTGALAVRAVGRAIDSVTGNTADKPQVSRDDATRRNEDKQWLEEQQKKRSEVSMSEEQKAQHAQNEAVFFSGIRGTPRPPNDVIQLPLGFGLTALRTVETLKEPLKVEGPVPRPLAPVTAPTPDEHHKQVVSETHNARESEKQQAMARPEPKGLLGKAFKTVALGARFTAGLAMDAKNAVEDKVRESTFDGELNKFRMYFSSESQTSALKVAYTCRALAGDGTSREGRLFVSDKGIHFTTLEEQTGVVATAGGALQPSGGVVHFSLMYTEVVTVVRGACVNDQWLSLITADLGCRSLYNFNSNVAAKIGSVMSVSLNGTPFERAYNWIDHMWRAASVVPRADFPYDQGTSTAQSRSPGMRATPPPAEPVAQENPCCICLENPRNTFFLPCGHVCTCTSCGESIDTCPMCRAEIRQRFEAFL